MSILKFDDDKKPEYIVGTQQKTINNNQNDYEEQARREAVEIADRFRADGVTPEVSQQVYQHFLQTCTSMTNYDFYRALVAYSGFLTEEQRKTIIETYVKTDGDIQIKYYDINKKARDQAADLYKAKLDENQSIFSRSNAEIANRAAHEANKMADLIKSYKIGRKDSENAVTTIREGDGKSKFGDLMNLKAGNVILTAKNGKVVQYNNREELEKLIKYKNNISKKPEDNVKVIDKNASHPIETDDEWS